MPANRTAYKSGVNASIFTNKLKFIKGDTVRDKLNLLADSALFWEDGNVSGGFLQIDSITGLVDISFIQAASPSGKFLKDDGTWDDPAGGGSSDLQTTLGNGNTSGPNNIFFDDDYGIDTNVSGDTLNIGFTNAAIINYGNGSAAHNFFGAINVSDYSSLTSGFRTPEIDFIDSTNVVNANFAAQLSPAPGFYFGTVSNHPFHFYTNNGGSGFNFTAFPGNNAVTFNPVVGNAATAVVSIVTNTSLTDTFNIRNGSDTSSFFAVSKTGVISVSGLFDAQYLGTEIAFDQWVGVGTYPTIYMFQSAGTARHDFNYAMAVAGNDMFLNGVSNVHFQISGNDKLQIGGGLAAFTSVDIRIGTLGRGVQVKGGVNSRIGTAALVAGTVTVPNTTITASTRVKVTVQALGTVTVMQAVGMSSFIANTSFTIISSSLTDTSTVMWELTEEI